MSIFKERPKSETLCHNVAEARERAVQIRPAIVHWEVERLLEEITKAADSGRHHYFESFHDLKEIEVLDIVGDMLARGFRVETSQELSSDNYIVNIFW